MLTTRAFTRAVGTSPAAWRRARGGPAPTHIADMIRDI
jgi:AraC-like DNA-binding protein